MLWLTIMFLLTLWLLGYGYRVGGNAIHLLLVPVGALLVVALLRPSLPKLFRQKPPSAPVQGQIKWFNPEKGFGLIEREGGPDVMFQLSDSEIAEQHDLREGDWIEFVMAERRAISAAQWVVCIKSLRRSA